MSSWNLHNIKIQLVVSAKQRVQNHIYWLYIQPMIPINPLLSVALRHKHVILILIVDYVHRCYCSRNVCRCCLHLPCVQLSFAQAEQQASYAFPGCLPGWFFHTRAGSNFSAKRQPLGSQTNALAGLEGLLVSECLQLSLIIVIKTKTKSTNPPTTTFVWILINPSQKFSCAAVDVELITDTIITTKVRIILKGIVSDELFSRMSYRASFSGLTVH